MSDGKTDNEMIIPTTCASHCGGTCVLKVHVKDGVITRTETDNGEEPQLRACLRGRALRQRVYAENRILYPMKRVGERGEGKFERISWDEATEKVASEYNRIREAHGPLSILYLPMAGDLGSLHTVNSFRRLLSMAGGFTSWWAATSFHGGMFSSHYTYGSIFCANDRADLLNSRMIIMWGWNPATTISGTNTNWYLAQAKEKGAKIIAVDPVYTDSAATFADEWIPMLPGTDAAMLMAMAYVMITENLRDQKFIDTYSIGFEKFKEYVLGKEDGTPKTPSWAEAITRVPAETIEKLAREYATIKPAALMAGIGPGRTAYGEQYHRAAVTLATMTGNVGVPGGDAAARAWESVVGGYPYPVFMGMGIPFTVNPVDSPTPPALMLHESDPHIHYTKMADAMLEGKKGGYPADYKMAFFVNTNYLVSLPNINKIIKALQKLEFIAIEEQFMTPTVKYSDIVLPSSTYLERDDIALGVGSPFYGFQNKIIEPVGETKPHNDIAKILAEKLGIDDYDNETEEARLRMVAELAQIPDYDAFKKKGLYRVPQDEPHVAFRAQIEDPENNPFPTPSGKIEIYSEQIEKMGKPNLPSIPKYIETWESPNDPMAKKYPIQLVTNHFKRRSNAQFDAMPWLRELVPQAITVNAADAKARGIQNGDMVRVFNDRGETRLPAEVSHRMTPGVANLPQGAWYDPDEKGIDRAGSANVLTKDEHSPAGSFPYNTVLAQIEKV